MRNPVRVLFDLAGRHTASSLTRAEFSELFDADTLNTLQHAGLLLPAKNRLSVACASCDDQHAVFWSKIDEGVYVSLCDRSTNATPQRVQEGDIVCWQITRNTIVTSVAHALKAECNIKAINGDDIWNVGTCVLGKNRYTILFLAPQSARRHISFINTLATSSSVLVFTDEHPPQEKNDRVHFLNPESIFALRNNGLIADIAALQSALEGAYRRVVLEQNGDLKLDGKTLCNIPPHSAEYTFARRLMEDYGHAVSHDELYRRYVERYGMDSKRTAQKYCNDTRSEISKLAGKNKPSVRKIIVIAKTADKQNAYKIQNPIEKVTAK